MVFILPRTIGGPQSFALLPPLNFISRYLGKKRTAASLTNQFVYIGHHIYRQDDMRPSAHILLHTASVT